MEIKDEDLLIQSQNEQSEAEDELTDNEVEKEINNVLSTKTDQNDLKKFKTIHETSQEADETVMADDLSEHKTESKLDAIEIASEQT